MVPPVFPLQLLVHSLVHTAMLHPHNISTRTFTSSKEKKGWWRLPHVMSSESFCLSLSAKASKPYLGAALLQASTCHRLLCSPFTRTIAMSTYLGDRKPALSPSQDVLEDERATFGDQAPFASASPTQPSPLDASSSVSNGLQSPQALAPQQPTVPSAPSHSTFSRNPQGNGQTGERKALVELGSL